MTKDKKEDPRKVIQDRLRKHLSVVDETEKTIDRWGKHSLRGKQAVAKLKASASWFRRK